MTPEHLRELVAAADHDEDCPAKGSYSGSVWCRCTAGIARDDLNALAPEGLALLADAMDLLKGILFDLSNGDDPGRGQKAMGADLLARFAEMGDTA